MLKMSSSLDGKVDLFYKENKISANEMFTVCTKRKYTTGQNLANSCLPMECCKSESKLLQRQCYGPTGCLCLSHSHESFTSGLLSRMRSDVCSSKKKTLNIG